MDDFEPIEEENVVKKKNKNLLFLIIAVIVILLALLAYYVQKMGRARYIYDKAIDEIISFDEAEEYNSIKVNGDFGITINSDEQNTEDVSSLLNDATFSFQVEADKSKKEELVGLQISKSEEELLNAKLKLETENKNVYLNLGELFDKTIQLDASDLSSDSFELFDTESMTFLQQVNANKAEKIMRKEIKSELKEEYFSKEKATVNGENVTKNTLKMSGEQIYTAIINVCQNLAKDEEFTSCFEDPEEMKDSLQEIVDSLGGSEMDDDTFKMEIALYTKGISKKVKKIDAIVEDDTDEINLELIKETEEDYTYQLTSDDETMEGKVKIKLEKNSFVFGITIKEDGTEIGINLSTNVAYDEQLSDFDMANVVKQDEMTQDDFTTLGNNFMESELYKVIDDIFNLSASNSVLEQEVENQSETEEQEMKEQVVIGIEELIVNYYTEVYEDENADLESMSVLDYIIDHVSELETEDYRVTISGTDLTVIGENTILTGTIDENASVSWDDEDDWLTMEDTEDGEEEPTGEINVVKTFNDDTIKFNVPDSFHCYSSSSDSYKLFEKEVLDEYVNVDVSIEYETMDEYTIDVRDTRKEYTQDSDYRNVDMKEENVIVNGNTFKKMTIAYDYVYEEDDIETCEEAYIAYEIDDKNLYVVEIDNSHLIEDSELEQFLTIEK